MKPFIFTALVFLTACTGTPNGIEPVTGFELNRYLGSWYEIARLDHSFERGLTQVTANYSLNENASVKVINRGFSEAEQQWDKAEGKAYFVQDEQTGHLKVSFFGPFYGSYVIFKLDKADYQYAYVTSFNRDYLWFLARTPLVSAEQRSDFINSAKAAGFDTEALIFVKQTDNQ